MSITKEQLVNWLKLTNVSKLGPSKILRLFGLVPDIDQIFSMSDEELFKTRIFNEFMIHDFNKLKDASKENFLKVINECEANNIEIVPIINEQYPLFLKNVSYPPLTLFLKGDLNLLNKKKIAIVGSRKADEKAKEWTYNLAKYLVRENFVIVSGGAVGIDYSAHMGALENGGNTICVLGSGFFKMFPEKHAALFNEISKKDLLISEHLPNFPGSNIALVQRNRITSGISNALVMVASGERGGSMIQTKMAFEQRKLIFCPKLSLNLQPNEGINQIITDWKGIEIELYREIIDKLTEYKESSQTKLIF
jgi:DNA processing protein